MNMESMKSALAKLWRHTQPTKSERVAQFDKIRKYATRYKEGVNGLQHYLQQLQNEKIKMKTDCYFEVVKDGWNAYLEQVLNRINNFIQNDYNTWMAIFEQQETQCAEEARDLVIIGTLKQMLKLWPEQKMSYCVLGTDYRADMEAEYGTPYAALVTDKKNPEKLGDNEPIDQEIWNMMAVIEITDAKLRNAIAALT
jgi:hypothetical protein